MRSSALIIASWARYFEGTDESGNPIEIVDRRKVELLARASKYDTHALTLIEDEDLFGGLAKQAHFALPYREALESLRRLGARNTLALWERTTIRAKA